ncbi:MAG: hypothetical protein ACJAZ1_003445 [Yoonia sp.]|jgi:hypothetical protein
MSGFDVSIPKMTALNTITTTMKFNTHGVSRNEAVFWRWVML